MKHNLNLFAQKLGESLPEFGLELKDAGVNKGVVEYLSQSLLLAGMAALLAFAGSAVAFLLNNKPHPTLSVILAVLAFTFILAVQLKRPSQMMKSRAARIEKSLVFSLHAINIEMKSGINFSQAMQDIAEKDYGEFSAEMRRILEEAHKYSLKTALENSARRNPSKIYRRAIWQIVNSLETGADIHANVKSIIEDLKRAQEDEAHRYGKSMENQLALYVMGGIVFPALSVVIIQTISSLGLSKNFESEYIYWLVLLFSLIIQVFFLYMIKFGKPTLLGESLIQSFKAKNPIEHIKRMLEYAGSDTHWKRFILSRLIMSLGSGIILTIILKPYIQLGHVPLLFLTTALSAVTLYTHLAYCADNRGLKAAEYLPDSLRIMAANMEAGIAIDQALFMSARPEFGVLSREIQLMGTDMVKNLSFEEALGKLKRRIKSEPLHMSINLISHGLKTGSGLAESLFHIADILQDREYVRQTVATQLHAVRTMVLILVMVSAPLLYSCSVVSGSIMNHFNEKIRVSIPPQVLSQSWLKPGGSPITVGFLNKYIMVNLMLTALMGSIIIGEVTTGRSREGLRYMFIMILVSEILYVVIKTVLMDKIGGAFM